MARQSKRSSSSRRRNGHGQKVVQRMVEEEAKGVIPSIQGMFSQAVFKEGRKRGKSKRKIVTAVKKKYSF